MNTNKKVSVRKTEKIRVLICDDDGQTSRRMLDFLTLSGFECRTVSKGSEAKKILLGWKPRIVLVDMLFPEMSAFSMLHYMQHEIALKKAEIKVIVMSSHNNEDNVRESYNRGAVDYMARPIMYQDLLARIVFHCRSRREVEDSASKQRDSLKIADMILNQTLQRENFEKILYKLTQMATLRLKGARCSLIRQVTFENGAVLASSDKEDIAGLHLDLRKYPEVQLVLNTGKTVVIENLEESRALSKIKKDLKNINFNSLVVCPIYYKYKMFGVLSMRMPPERTAIENNEILFMEFLAKAMSLYLTTVAAENIGKYGPIAA
jgi:DNA-binding response OmpR family regulator